MYITKDDLINRYGSFEIERLEKSIGDEQAVDKAIVDAMELVNGYVATHYRLPLPIIPASVARACAVVARYYLYKDKPTDSIRQDYEDVLLWLKDVASGKVKLALGNDDVESPKAFYQTGAFVV